MAVELANTETDTLVAVAQVGEEPTLTWGQWCSQIGTSIKARSGKDWAFSFFRVFCLVFFLYFFLFSLNLMGESFNVVGGCSSGGLFNSVTNPIAGLMIGILATVLVQSSSTSTSVVVSMVGASAMSVRVAVPIIMGANIGTSVTNTFVSLGQANDKEQFKRAFAGATVHDMFNFLSVLILLPIEAATHFLEEMTSVMIPDELTKGEKWTGPIKVWVGPLVKAFIEPDKKVIEKVANGETTCEAMYEVGKGSLIKSGVFQQDGSTLDQDYSSGVVCLVISLILLCLCLGGLVKTLQKMIAGTSDTMLKKATNLNGYVAMLIGTGVTILVQSSSITTSVLTPMVGLGILKLENMYPLTLGANIGTTCTALLASMVSTKPAAVQIALCHLFFNLIGVTIWYPVPIMRRLPIRMATNMGEITARYRFFPVLYIAVMFVLVPLGLLGLSSLFTMGIGYQAIGIIVTTFLIIALIYTIFWYYKRSGKESIMKYLEAKQTRSDVFTHLPTTIETLTQQITELQKQNKDLSAHQKDLDEKLVEANSRSNPPNNGLLV